MRAPFLLPNIPKPSKIPYRTFSKAYNIKNIFPTYRLGFVSVQFFYRALYRFLPCSIQATCQRYAKFFDSVIKTGDWVNIRVRFRNFSQFINCYIKISRGLQLATLCCNFILTDIVFWGNRKRNYVIILRI